MTDEHSHGVSTKIFYFVARKIVSVPVKFLLIKKIKGLNNIPKKGPLILAFNHQSIFDFLCFAAIAPRNVHFLSAEKFFEHKIWRHLMRSTGQIKVSRNEHDKSMVHSNVAWHLKNNLAIGIFPEGTRSPDKDKMLKAFTGVAKYALLHEVPVIPIGIRGTYEVMAKHDKKPRLIKNVEIHIGEILHFKEHFGKENNHELYTHVTEKIMKEIENLSGKTYPHYENHYE